MTAILSTSLLLLLAPSVLSPAPEQVGGPSQGETSGAAYASLALSASPAACYVHEPFRLRLEIRFDAEFARANMIQLFRRPMDAPLAVQATWLTELPGAEALGAPPLESKSSGMSLAAGDEVVRAARVEDVTEDGRAYTVLVLERVFRPTRAGVLEIPGAALRFAYATEFREDFAAGRVPVDRHDAVVHCPPITLAVQRLPEKEQPASFSGAVGRFTVRASAQPVALDVGESLALTLVIEGAGFLGSIEAPRLEAAGGFDSLGVVDHGGSSPRTITYDLAPRSASVRAIPAIPFVFFDPGPPATYRTVSTSAIPITVRPPAAAPAEKDGARESGRGAVRGGPQVAPRDPLAPDPAAESPAPGPLTTALLAGAALLALVTWLVRRAGRGAPGPVERAQERAAGAAGAAFRSRLDGGGDLAQVFTEFLAARLDCPVPGVIGPRLADRLHARGVQPELARRAAELLDALVAARYGGAAPEGAEDEVRALVERMR